MNLQKSKIFFLIEILYMLIPMALVFSVAISELFLIIIVIFFLFFCHGFLLFCRVILSIAVLNLQSAELEVVFQNQFHFICADVLVLKCVAQIYTVDTLVRYYYFFFPVYGPLILLLDYLIFVVRQRAVACPFVPVID